ncbi:hypothetical protein H10PHJ05_36 [Aeromonas phage HJ05]|nr:hypothetical protein H10PHJ05_36 [Aeromonas phage HJ05]
MNVSVIKPAEHEPVTVAQAKAFCRVTHNLEDALIATLVSAARELCEGATRSPISPQTFQVTYRTPYHDTLFGLHPTVEDRDGIKDGIRLPRIPFLQLVSVKLETPEQTIDIPLSAVRVAKPRTLYIKDWPTYFQRDTSLVVEYEAGYPLVGGEGEDKDLVKCPALMAQCVLDTVAHLYSTRGDATTGTLPVRVRNMLKTFSDVGGWAG